jgi:hypothetical protein
MHPFIDNVRSKGKCITEQLTENSLYKSTPFNQGVLGIPISSDMAARQYIELLKGHPYLHLYQYNMSGILTEALGNQERCIVLWQQSL